MVAILVDMYTASALLLSCLASALPLLLMSLPGSLAQH